MTDDRSRTAGRRVIVTVYLALVAFAALFGALLGVIVPAKQTAPPMASFGPLAFEITPLSMALFGAVSIGVSLGGLLVLVTVVADRFDAADPVALDAAVTAETNGDDGPEAEA